MTSQKIGLQTYHYLWNNSHKPVARINSGDTVEFDVNEVMSWQITQKSKAEVFSKLDYAKLYPLSGPVYVEGATSRDALQVTVKEIETADWGWTGIVPGMGLLPEFKKP